MHRIKTGLICQRMQHFLLARSKQLFVKLLFNVSTSIFYIYFVLRRTRIFVLGYPTVWGIAAFVLGLAQRAPQTRCKNWSCGKKSFTLHTYRLFSVGLPDFHLGRPDFCWVTPVSVGIARFSEEARTYHFCSVPAGHWDTKIPVPGLKSQCPDI